MTDAAFHRELKRLKRFFQEHVRREVLRRSYASSRGEDKRVKHRRAIRMQRKRAMKRGKP